MFVVMGVSGNTGSVVAQTLLDLKRPVRVVVRDAKKGEAWRARGAEVAVADAADTAALSRAFAGATGVYALLPPDLQSNEMIARGYRLADALAGAAKTAKVPHLVLLSSIGAQHASGTGPIKTVHYAEKQLREAGVVSTFIRAAVFLENNLAAIELVKTKSILPVFADPTFSFPTVATKDIGLLAAKALIEGAKETSVIELSGPREYSSDDVAKAFGTVLGKTVTTVVAPLDQLVPTYVAMGVSADVAGQYKELFEGMFAGKLAWEGGAARSIRGGVDVDTFAKNALAR